MNVNGRAMSRYLLITATCALPCVLIFSSFRTFRELDEQKRVYLRQRIADIAAKLETLPPDSDGSWLASLERSEPHLRDLKIITRDTPAAGTPALDPIWDGQELYLTGTVTVDGDAVFRAYVPFHTNQGLRIAAIDLDANAADFLLVHARHNILTALAGGLALVILSIYAVWMARRTASLERRQLELEDLARLGRLSATLAHEIRNPLGTIKGFTQLAAERADGSTGSLLAPVLAEAGRLEKLVGDLLAYGRPPIPSIAPVSWSDVVVELEQYGEQIPKTNTLRLGIEAPPVCFDTDINVLKQILFNLLKNAFDAVAAIPAPEVSLRIRPAQPSGIEIVISDNGPGLGAATEKLFEPFFTTKASGTGLGLSISKQLAKSLGGDLQVHDRVPHGVEAVLSLDTALRPAQAAASA